jgi:hypothetical protein
MLRMHLIVAIILGQRRRDQLPLSLAMGLVLLAEADLDEFEDSIDTVVVNLRTFDFFIRILICNHDHNDPEDTKVQCDCHQQKN